MRYLWIFDVGCRETMEYRPGWALHVFPFALLGTCLGFCVAIGLDPMLPVVMGSALFLACSRKIIAQNVRRIRRMGWFAPTRARWWIELAALDWTLCIAGGSFWIVRNMAAGGLVWGNAVLLAAQYVIGWTFCAFFPLTVAGYVVGLIRGRRLAGGSLETVNFFFWMLVAIFLMQQAPPLATWFGPAVAMIGLSAGAVAGLLALRQRARRSRLMARPRG